MKQIKNEVIPIKIREEREKLGLNQAQLAQKAKITPAAVSQIEKGFRTPSIPVLQKIAQVLGVSMDYLSGNTAASEIDDLLQNEEIREFYRGFRDLQNEDKRTILQNIEFLKAKYKGGKLNK